MGSLSSTHPTNLLCHWLWTLGDCYWQTDRFPVAHQLDRDSFAGRQVGYGFQHGTPIVDGVAVYRDQNISGLYAGLIRRAAAHHFGNQHAFDVAELEGFGQFGSEFLHACADPAARHGAVLLSLIHISEPTRLGLISYA